jgi:hypothetical protein
MSADSDSTVTWIILGFLLFLVAVSPTLGFVISVALKQPETQISARWPTERLPMQDLTGG